MSDETWEPDPVIPGFLQNAMNEADAEHFDEGQEPPEPLEEDPDEDRFDGDVADDVLGLMNLGRLQHSYEVLGHRIVLRTLTIGEELAIGQVVNQFAGTLGQGKAFQTAILATAIVSVDGRDLVGALGPDTQATITDKFNYVSERWYMTTLDLIWANYQELLTRQQRAYEALLVKSTASRTSSTP